MSNNIAKEWPISASEYNVLTAKFGRLAHYAAWQLKKNNANSNYNEDHEDISQELHIALMVAGSYYKRQTYIESCLSLLETYLTDPLMRGILKELNELWTNRQNHGANRQTFGTYQEELLDQLATKYVPENLCPKKNQALKVDGRFSNYCKRIIWNKQKNMGCKITKEKGWRSGLVSLSEHEYLINAD